MIRKSAAAVAAEEAQAEQAALALSPFDPDYGQDHRTVLLAQRYLKHYKTQVPQTCKTQQDACGKESCFVDIFNGEKQKQFKMKVFADDLYVSRVALCTGTVWEFTGSLQVQGMLQRLAPTTKGSFLDVGANIGSWSLTVAAFMRDHLEKKPAHQLSLAGVQLSEQGVTRNVIAVEANPRTASTLGESIAANQMQGRIKSYAKALVRDSSAVKSICLFDGKASGNVGGSRGVDSRKAATSKQCAGPNQVAVPTVNLDSIYQAEPSMQEVVAAKFDCEGCEGQAILGAQKFFMEKPPCTIAMEVTENYLCMQGTPLKEVKAFLTKAGYDTGKLAVHGDGTCESYLAWEKRLGQGVVHQEFVVLEQRNMPACMARFLGPPPSPASVSATGR